MSIHMFYDYKENQNTVKDAKLICTLKNLNQIYIFHFISLLKSFAVRELPFDRSRGCNSLLVLLKSK